MESSLNETQTTPKTSNPQDAVPTDGSSNAADFQSTAPQETLNKDTDSLSVQETGDPLQGTTTAAIDSGFSTMMFIVVGLLIIGAIIFYKLMKETVDENNKPAPKPAAKASAAAKRTTAKKTAVKKPVKKKTPSGKPLKKTTRKKR